MTAKLNHTIVYARDKHASASFLSEVLGLPAPVPFGPFMGVQAGNEVTLDFIEADGQITPQHNAFLISEAEFDEIFARIRERKLSYSPDPGQYQRGRINTTTGGLIKAGMITMEHPSPLVCHNLVTPRMTQYD